MSGITVACSSCRGPLPSGSGRPATLYFVSTVDFTAAHALFMTHPALFDKGSPLPNNSQISISPRAASLWPTATRQFSSGHCTTHAGAVHHKKALRDYTLCLDRSACQCRSAPRAPKQLYRALHNRAALSSSRDALDLRAFRLKDVLQPPGDSKQCYNHCKYFLNLTCPLAILLFCPSPFPFS